MEIGIGFNNMKEFIRNSDLTTIFALKMVARMLGAKFFQVSRKQIKLGVRVTLDVEIQEVVCTYIN